MAKATEDELGTLHGEIARGLTNAIAEGVTIAVKEDGTVVKSAAPASYFMAGLKMLADNNITADPATNKAIAELNEALKARQNKRRGTLSREALDAAAEVLERDMGGTLQ